MTRIAKRLAAVAVATCLALSLTACGLGGTTSFDATLYIKGHLDQNYLGVHDEAFLTLIDSTEKESIAAYESNIDMEYEDRFCKAFVVDDASITDETRDALKQLLRDVYSHAKYEVAAAESLANDEYSVKTTIRPISLFAEFAADELDALLNTFLTEYESITEEMVDVMTDAEAKDYTALYEEDWAQRLLAALEPHLADVGYHEPVTKLIRVYPDDATKGLYTFSDEDMVGMDDLILAY